jgi:dTMP kinase
VNSGFLLALEGIDGSGKSTAAAGIVRALREEGAAVVATREPTDGPFGRRIRAMASSGETVEPAEELRWFLEDRREHVRRVIAPALAAGRTVVTDRYFLSTVAYQGARGHDWKQLLADAEREFPVPDLALLFEIAPAAGLARTHGRAGAAEPAFEEQAFLERVAAVYRAIERPWLQRVDASRDQASLLADALGRVRSALARVHRALA